MNNLKITIILLLFGFKSWGNIITADTITKIEPIPASEKALLLKLKRYHPEIIVSDSIRYSFVYERSEYDSLIVKTFVVKQLVVRKNGPFVIERGRDTEIISYDLVYQDAGVGEGISIIYSYSMGRVLTVTGTALIINGNVTQTYFSCGYAGNCSTITETNGVKLSKSNVPAKTRVTGRAK